MATNKTKINVNHTIDQYDKKYGKLGLRKIQKKYVDQDESLLNGSSWWLIEDAYYELPKHNVKLKLKNMSKAGKIALCVLGVGAVASAIVVPTAIAINNRVVVLTAEKDDADGYVDGDIKFTKQEDGSYKTTVKLNYGKNLYNNIDVTVYVNDRQLATSKYQISNNDIIINKGVVADGAKIKVSIKEKAAATKTKKTIEFYSPTYTKPLYTFKTTKSTWKKLLKTEITISTGNTLVIDMKDDGKMIIKDNDSGQYRLLANTANPSSNEHYIYPTTSILKTNIVYLVEDVSKVDITLTIGQSARSVDVYYTPDESSPNMPIWNQFYKMIDQNNETYIRVKDNILFLTGNPSEDPVLFSNVNEKPYRYVQDENGNNVTAYYTLTNKSGEGATYYSSDLMNNVRWDITANNKAYLGKSKETSIDLIAEFKCDSDGLGRFYQMNKIYILNNDTGSYESFDCGMEYIEEFKKNVLTTIYNNQKYVFCNSSLESDASSIVYNDVELVLVEVDS